MTDRARTYYTVPGPYGYGPEFEAFEQAEAHARSTIREVDGCPGEFTRAFVDTRVRDGGGDYVAQRVEVKHDDLREEVGRKTWDEATDLERYQAVHGIGPFGRR